jgi:chaperonin cofactor prefoldin
VIFLIVKLLDMEKKELLKSIHQKIDDLNYKIGVLKKMASQEADSSRRNEMESTVTDMEKLRDDTYVQYDKLYSVQEKDDTRLSEMEQNIFSNIRSFDSAFKKAGGIFDSRHENR